jgi:uncharacterized RDD family membrane protein YckC
VPPVPTQPGPGYLHSGAPQAGYGPGYTQPGYPQGYAQPGYPQGYAQPGYPQGYAPPPGYAAPKPTAPGGQPLAEFSDRLVAAIIDGLIVGGIYAVIIIPAYLILIFSLLPSTTVVNGQNVGPTDAEVAGVLFLFFGIFVLVFLFALVVSYVYEVEFMLRNRGQTFGKRIMKIQVVPFDPAQPLTRGICFKRFLVHRVAATLIPAFSWVDGLWQLWDQPYRQCLHDKYAKTVVIKIVA